MREVGDSRGDDETYIQFTVYEMMHDLSISMGAEPLPISKLTS